MLGCLYISASIIFLLFDMQAKIKPVYGQLNGCSAILSILT